MLALSHNARQAHVLKALVAVRVVKKAGVLATTAARPQVVVTLAVSRVLTRRAVTNLLPTVASARLPHVATSLSHLAVTSLLLHVAISRLQIAAKNPSLHVAIGLLLRVVKNHTHLVAKNRLVIAAMPHVAINLMPHAAKILTRMRVLSHALLNPALTAAPQIAQRMQASLLARHATSHLVAQRLAVKPLHHAVTAQHARVQPAQVRHVPRQVHAAVLPLTAVAVKL